MQQMAWVHKNWLNATSVLLGAAGLLAGYYFYSVSTERRIPVFGVAAQRTDIFTAERANTTPIRVFTSDGQPVKNDVTAVRWYFWNAGRRSMKLTDVLEPLRISLDDPNGRILDYRIVKASRQVSGVTVERDNADPSRTLLVTFRILERNDGVVGEILWEGKRTAVLRMGGVIEGAAAFATPESLARDRRPVAFLKTMLGVVAVCAAIGLFFGAIGLLARLTDRSPRANAAINRYSGLFVIVLLIMMLLVVIYVGTTGEESRARREPSVVAPLSLGG